MSHQPTLTLRHATVADTPAVAALEAACFPPAEAASEASYAARLATFPHRFWLLFAEGELVSMVCGCTTHEPDLRDEMFRDPTLHQPDGPHQMIFTVATHPDHRNRGYAGTLLRAMLEDCRREGRASAVLTCKAHRLAYYAAFGFVNEGLSPSDHGGATWYQMRATL